MRQVVQKWADATSVVAGGRLDLDDVGAHVAKQPRAEWCAMSRQVEDAQARERRGGDLRHGFSVDFGAAVASISFNSSLTLGGGRSSMANALVSRVGGT